MPNKRGGPNSRVGGKNLEKLISGRGGKFGDLCLKMRYNFALSMPTPKLFYL